MSTINKQACRLINPGRIYFVVTFLLSFFLAGVWHELGHGIGSGLTGGDWGFASSSGNIIGGYSLENIYFLVPVFSVGFMDPGNRTIMLLAGPFSVILVAWYLGLRWNVEALDGPCGGRNKWMRRRGIVWGVLLRAGFDSVYLLPIDVFPERAADGDGTVLHRIFVDQGLFVEEIMGIPWFFSLQHVIGAFAIVVTIYVTWVVVRSQITNCAVGFVERCSI